MFLFGWSTCIDQYCSVDCSTCAAVQSYIFFIKFLEVILYLGGWDRFYNILESIWPDSITSKIQEPNAENWEIQSATSDELIDFQQWFEGKNWYLLHTSSDEYVSITNSAIWRVSIS